MFSCGENAGKSTVNVVSGLDFIVSDLMALFDWEEASFSFSKPEVQNVRLFIFLAAKQVRLTWCSFRTGFG